MPLKPRPTTLCIAASSAIYVLAGPEAGAFALSAFALLIAGNSAERRSGNGANESQAGDSGNRDADDPDDDQGIKVKRAVSMLRRLIELLR